MLKQVAMCQRSSDQYCAFRSGYVIAVVERSWRCDKGRVGNLQDLKKGVKTDYRRNFRTRQDSCRRAYSWDE
jgi:hypothetical protein